MKLFLHQLKTLITSGAWQDAKCGDCADSGELHKNCGRTDCFCFCKSANRFR